MLASTCSEFTPHGTSLSTGLRPTLAASRFKTDTTPDAYHHEIKLQHDHPTDLLVVRILRGNEHYSCICLEVLPIDNEALLEESDRINMRVQGHLLDVENYSQHCLANLNPFGT